MPVRRSVAVCVLAAGVIGASGAPPAGAQGFGAPPPYTPEPGAKDLKAVLFNWAWHMGMLRGQAEPELVATLEYRAEGTIQVDGEPCELTLYRISANYQIPGYRTQIECTRPNGERYTNIETVSGEYAWDEDIPGAEIIPGRGKATPRPAALEERLIRLWASPHGAPKAAIAAAAGVPFSESFAQNPAVLLDRQAAAGVRPMTTLSWQGDKAVLTFPIPGVPGATATATLDESFLPERVVVRHGRNTTEFLYGNFQDWNNPLHRIEALYAGTIVERRNGEVVRDLKTTQTEIGQVYVVVPVPESVRAARTAASAAATPVQAQVRRDAPERGTSAETPRLPNGKPDLTGSWRLAAGGPMRVPGGMFRRCSPFQSNCMEWTNQSADFVFMAPSRLEPNRPLYKPEHWDKVQELDMWTNKYDPVMTCLPLGIPRHGPPARIFHTEDDITMIYRGGIDGGGGYPEFRMIRLDGRPHDPEREFQFTYMGYTVGRWEGDTLVLDSIGFSDETWLGRGGLFHSDQMRVIEKFTRTGNELLYEVTVEDPVVLVEPWVMHPRILRLADEPTIIPERGSCTDVELEEVTTQIRH
ncbi:MAG TPA: hypothetical protein VIN61_01685 [Gammaproteobacteria bacterium]